MRTAAALSSKPSSLTAIHTIEMASPHDTAPARSGRPGRIRAHPGPGLGRRFWLLFTSTTVSNLGDGITVAALPLLVASLTRDPAAVAGVALASRLPWLLFALPVGALTDRLDRRRTMIAANLVRGTVAAALAVVVATGSAEVWMLYVSGFVIGIAEVFYDNAAQTFLPSIVAASQLSTANGRMLTAELVANSFAGPPLGALLFTVAVSLPFLLDAGSFLLTVPLLIVIGGSYRATGPDTAGAGGRTAPRRRLHVEIAEGLRWLWGNQLLRLLAVMLAVANFAGTMGQAIFVLFAQEELEVGDRAFGVLLTAFAVGGVAGGMVASRVHRRAGHRAHARRELPRVRRRRGPHRARRRPVDGRPAVGAHRARRRGLERRHRLAPPDGDPRPPPRQGQQRLPVPRVGVHPPRRARRGPRRRPVRAAGPVPRRGLPPARRLDPRRAGAGPPHPRGAGGGRRRGGRSPATT